MSTTIYYYSATGNTLWVARQLAGQLGNCSLVPITSVMNDKPVAPGSESVGFVFPLYYTAVPEFVEQFINKLDLSKATYVFGITTPGAMKMGAIAHLQRILARKSKQLNAGFYVVMPDNYIIMLKLPDEPKQRKIFADAASKLTHIAEIINKRESKIETSFFSDLIANIICWFWKRGLHTRDRKFFTNASCNGCGTCVKLCPVENILLQNSRPVWQHHCQNCLACIHLCPSRAIEWGNKTASKGRYKHPDIPLKDLLVRN